MASQKFDITVGAKQQTVYNVEAADKLFLPKSGGQMSGVITSPASPTSSAWAHAIDGANGSGELSFSTQTQDARLLSMHNLLLGANNEITLDAKDIKVVLEPGGTRGNTSVAMLSDITSAVGAYVKKAGDKMSGTLNMDSNDITAVNTVETSQLSNSGGDFVIDLEQWDSGGITVPVDIDMGGASSRKQIHNLETPTTDYDAANKKYVDGQIPTGVNQTANLNSTTAANSISAASIGVSGVLPATSGGTGNTSLIEIAGVPIINGSAKIDDFNDVVLRTTPSGWNRQLLLMSLKTNGAANAPTGGNADGHWVSGWLGIDGGSSSNYGLQLAFKPRRDETNQIWRRHYDNGTWGSWVALDNVGGGSSVTPVNGSWQEIGSDYRSGAKPVQILLPAGCTKCIVSIAWGKGSIASPVNTATIIPTSTQQLSGISGSIWKGGVLWLNAPFDFDNSGLTFHDAYIFMDNTTYDTWNNSTDSWYIKLDYF